ncbi:hypothetical protein BC936DRAFT_145200 [Jimgerdemannia flammicorona]|uniref:PPP domain-containing protein n=2 Tax=Jimgerdemannia flammicorona TaxID=994334 RepID=A0A433DAN6_9FUNG|nr:hypothetical protein BC936DRAFT_145200 [Jimgerdemannia flammicorona]
MSQEVAALSTQITRKDVSEEERLKAETIKDEANALFAAHKYKDAVQKYTDAINLNPKIAAYYANRSFAYTKTEAYGYAVVDAEKAIAADPSYVKGYYRRAIANMALCKFKESLRDFKMRAPNDKDAKAKLSECEKIVRRVEFEKAIEVRFCGSGGGPLIAVRMGGGNVTMGVSRSSDRGLHHLSHLVFELSSSQYAINPQRQKHDDTTPSVAETLNVNSICTPVLPSSHHISFRGTFAINLLNLPILHSFTLIVPAVEDSYDGPRINDNKICEQFVVDLLERFKEQKKLHKKYAFEVS